MKKSFAQKLTPALALLATGIGAALATPSPDMPTGPGQCVATDNGSGGTVYVGHPCPNRRPMDGPVTTLQPDGITFQVTTGTSLYAEVDPFLDPVHASNLLPNWDGNMFDGNGQEMLNTLPSSAAHPYNLHDTPTVSAVDKTSPVDDLTRLFNAIKNGDNAASRLTMIQQALDILEGNPLTGDLAGRAYNGLAVLHYKGPEKVKVVDGISKNANIHQVWYDGHIEADAGLLDVSQVYNTPFTITYTVDVLNRGEDDFAPLVMYFDDPALSAAGSPPMPHMSMDTTFFPMLEGKRYVFVMKMPPGKYYNLSYTWGWREHPPRVQVSENVSKKLPTNVDPVTGAPAAATKQTVLWWEQQVFGITPTADQASKLAAIARIGELAPEKRMWMAMNAAKTAGKAAIQTQLNDAIAALDDWNHRTRLPRGVVADPNADVTLAYLNNTIYGQMKGGGIPSLDKWRTRHDANSPDGKMHYYLTLLNGDHFVHSYMSAEFGGLRGWENQFQSTKGIGGSGCWFTFGRFHWWVNAGGPFGMINVPPGSTDGLTPTLRKIDMTMNFEPSRRLRIYNFDPAHHDTAVFSLH
ncbi:MAG: hypothetical protein ACOYMG_10405 [Candidatus Methylumidiphilus sp.]